MQLAGGDAGVDHEQSLGLALRVRASQRESVLAYTCVCVCVGIYLVMAMCVCSPVRESPNELILYVFRKVFSVVHRMRLHCFDRKSCNNFVFFGVGNDLCNSLRTANSLYDFKEGIP